MKSRRLEEVDAQAREFQRKVKKFEVEWKAWAKEREEDKWKT